MSDEHPPCLILSFLCRPSTQLPALDIGIKIVHMILEECKQLMDYEQEDTAWMVHKAWILLYVVK